MTKYFASFLIAVSFYIGGCSVPPICLEDGTLAGSVVVDGLNVYVERTAVLESQWDYSIGSLVHIGAATDTGLLDACRILDGSFVFQGEPGGIASVGDTLPAFDSFTSITGSLSYGELTVTRRFDAFNQVQSVLGTVDFRIGGMRIEGLRNLEHAGGIQLVADDFADFPALRAVDSDVVVTMRIASGFNELRTVGGDVRLESPDTTTSSMSEGFQALETVGESLEVRHWNDSVFDLPALTSVGLDVNISRSAFSTLRTTSLRTIGGGIGIANNPFLSSTHAREWAEAIAVSGDSPQADELGRIYVCHNADGEGTCENDSPNTEWP